jgi:hypothetical protein
MTDAGELETATGATLDVGSDVQVALSDGDSSAVLPGTAVTTDKTVEPETTKQRRSSSRKSSTGAQSSPKPEEQLAEKLAKPEKRAPYANPSRHETGGPKRVSVPLSLA